MYFIEEMNKGLEIIKNKLTDLEDEYQHYTMVEKDTVKSKLIKYDIEDLKTVEKELKKPQELYNKIKEKRDIREEYTRKNICDEDKSAICSEICAYNAVLLLMESMFEGLKDDYKED